jgi:hypothetical protein
MNIGNVQKITKTLHVHPLGERMTILPPPGNDSVTRPSCFFLLFLKFRSVGNKMSKPQKYFLF